MNKKKHSYEEIILKFKHHIDDSLWNSLLGLTDYHTAKEIFLINI